MGRDIFDDRYRGWAAQWLDEVAHYYPGGGWSLCKRLLLEKTTPTRERPRRCKTCEKKLAKANAVETK